mmetsp:Transcript_11017/g.23048  ORF Transcript_11017/g.23048 Transcript_11017/m.23048 type:complete len:616 (-) Transcript_11017:203-2050(-)
MVAMGSAKEVSTPPRLVSPIIVAEKPSSTPENRKYRLCHDLRRLNEFIKKYKFKLEQLADWGKSLARGDMLWSIDYESAYFHVPIRDHHHQFLGFEFDGRYYVFTCLPFGLSASPYIFTEVAKITARALRSELSLKVCSYIDDLLIGHAAGDDAMVRRSLDLIRSFGWRVNESKCALRPSTRLTGLGFVTDTIAMTFEVPEKRARKMMRVASEVWLQRHTCPARLVARLAGHLLSMQLALGLVVRLRSRYLLQSIRSASAAQDWRRLVQLSTRARGEVLRWLVDVTTLKPQPLHPHRVSSFDFELQVDTSDFATGGVVTRTPSGPCSIPIREDLRDGESELGSALRELRGYGRAFRALARRFPLQGRAVRMLVDASSAVHILRNGGSQTEDADGELALHEAALDIFETAAQERCSLRLRWRERAGLDAADAMSKWVDTMDFSLAPGAWQQVHARFGPFDVDRFASTRNARCARFNSKYLSPDAEAADALQQTWERGRSFVLPPFHTSVINDVVDILERDNADAVLVLPYWSHQPWWHRLCTSLRHRVAGWLEFPGYVLAPNSDDCFFLNHGSVFDCRVVVVHVLPEWRTSMVAPLSGPAAEGRGACERPPLPVRR